MVVCESDTPEIMHPLDEGHTIREETVEHLVGYRASRPVRVGDRLLTTGVQLEYLRRS